MHAADGVGCRLQGNVAPQQLVAFIMLLAMCEQVPMLHGRQRGLTHKHWLQMQACRHRNRDTHTCVSLLCLQKDLPRS